MWSICLVQRLFVILIIASYPIKYTFYLRPDPELYLLPLTPTLALSPADRNTSSSHGQFGWMTPTLARGRGSQWFIIRQSPGHIPTLCNYIRLVWFLFSRMPDSSSWEISTSLSFNNNGEDMSGQTREPSDFAGLCIKAQDWPCAGYARYYRHRTLRSLSSKRPSCIIYESRLIDE